MIYKLNNQPLSDFGAFPIMGREQIALSGLFDLPKRIGKTEYDWGVLIEPFVSVEDIQLDGRLLTLNTAMKNDKLEAFISACFTCNDFAIDFDSFSVVCRDEIEVERIGEYSKVVVKFWQNNFTLPALTKTPSISGAWLIDNFDLSKDFGVYVAEATRMRNGGKRIEVSTTEFYTGTDYRSTREIELHCFSKADSIGELYTNMRQLQALLMKPGLRKLKTKNDEFDFYFKGGIKAEFLGDWFLNFIITCTIV